MRLYRDREQHSVTDLFFKAMKKICSEPVRTETEGNPKVGIFGVDNLLSYSERRFFDCHAPLPLDEHGVRSKRGESL